MSLRLSLNLPSPFLEAWVPLLRVGEAILRLQRPAGNDWVVLALARKSARSMYAVASLASLDLWGDALVVGRALFETEVKLRSLLEGNYDINVRDYLDTAVEEQDRLQRKGRAGRSTSAQVLAAARVTKPVNVPPAPEAKKRRRTVRDETKPLDMERLYDLPYWIASTFAHSGVLSLAEWHEDLVKGDPQLAKMFALGHDDLPCWLTLSGVPTSATRTYVRVNARLGLGLGEPIQQAHELLKTAIAQTTGAIFDPLVPDGDLIVGTSPDDPARVQFSPKRE